MGGILVALVVFYVGYVVGRDRADNVAGLVFPSKVYNSQAPYSTGTIQNGPLQFTDMHVSGTDPNGMASVTGMVKNTSDREIQLDEVSIVDNQSVYFDDQKPLVLEPGEFYPVVLTAQSKDITSPDGHSLTIGYRQK